MNISVRTGQKTSLKMADIIYRIPAKNSGDSVLLAINRDGKMIDLYVTLQGRPNA